MDMEKVATGQTAGMEIPQTHRKLPDLGELLLDGAPIASNL
jgi:hypothetical protein